MAKMLLMAAVFIAVVAGLILFSWSLIKAANTPADRSKRLARKINKWFPDLYINRNGPLITVGTHPEHAQMAIKFTNDEILLVRGDGDWQWSDASVMYDDDAIYNMLAHHFPSK